MSNRGAFVQRGEPRFALRFRPQLEVLESRSLPSDVSILVFPSPSLLFSASMQSGEHGAGGRNHVAVPSSPASTGSPPAIAVAAAWQGVAHSTDGFVTRAGGVSVRTATFQFTQGAWQIVIGFPGPQAAAGEQSAAQTQLVTPEPSGDTGTGETRVVSLNHASAPSPPAAARTVTSPAEASPTPETTVANPVSPGHAPTPSNGITASSASVQVAPAYAPGHPAQATVQVHAPITTSHAAAHTDLPESSQARSLQVSVIGSLQMGVSATASGRTAPSSLTEQVVPGSEMDSRIAGEKEAAPAAVQRKALALGLRCLYPNMTDDEIAQAARVNRRTLFRWEEYVTIKKALRQVFKRPGGYKDRQGNIEAWNDDEG
jgi:hypothetical protein